MAQQRSLKWYLTFFLIKVQAFCIGAGGFLLITHFNLDEIKTAGDFAYFYKGMGFLSLFIVIYSICPIPEIEIKYINKVLDEEE